MAAQLSCPAGNRVSVLGQVSSSPGTICVVGRVNADEVGGTIRVRVQVQGEVGDPAGGLDVPVLAQDWCARGVPVPLCDDAGSDLRVFVWTVLAGSGGPTYRPDDDQPFVGDPSGGSGSDDCCSGCGSGMMETGPIAQAAASLGTATAVRVTVPDGPDAGHHSAGPTARLTWRATIGVAVCEVKLCPTAGLLVRVDGRPVEPAEVRFEPFSALLPGAAFGAAGPVLVTQA